MNLVINPKGELQIEDARIIYRNFSGAPSKYNREGDRNFAIVIDDEKVAEELQQNKWNVKIKPPREEGERPFMFLPVKIKFNAYGPDVHLISDGSKTILTEDMINILDKVEIVNVDIIIRPFDWGPINGKTGRAAYVKNLYVTHHVNDFDKKYGIFEGDDEEPPFDTD